MSVGSLFGQVAGLALLGAVYPPGMLIAALYLASERPGQTTVAYVIGGFVMVTVVGLAALFAIRAGGLSHFHQHQTRYGLRLGLGLLAIIASVVMFARRGRQPKEPKKPKKPSLIQRLSARPRPATAFAVGAVMFGPSVTFVAAVQVVATAKVSVADTVAAMALIIVLTVAFAWLPLVAYAVAPDRTIAVLRGFEAWLRRHGRIVLSVAIAVVGVILTIQGITGLALPRALGTLARR